MKNVSRILAVLLLILSVAFTFAACKKEENDAQSHQHSAAAAVRENEKLPTCTAEGKYEEVVYCSGCRAELSRVSKTTAAIGHKMSEYLSDENATCTEDGTKTKKCLNGCGHSETVREVGTAKGHVGAQPVFVDEYCGENRISRVFCTVCSECIGEYGHKYEKTVLQTSCLADGLATYTCRDCSHSYTEELKAQGHVSSTWTVTLEPSCAAFGEAAKFCLACGVMTETKTLEKLEHTYRSEYSENQITYICTVCSESYTEEMGSEIYEICFEENGALLVSDLVVAEGEVPSLPIPSRAGYIFVGWYTDSDLEEIYVSSEVYESFILFAKWEKIEIIQDEKDIVKGAPTSYTFVITSKSAVTAANVNDFVKITNAAGEQLDAILVYSVNGSYVIGCNFEEGTNYFVTLNGASFEDKETNELWILTAGTKENILKLNSGIKVFSLEDLYAVLEFDGKTVLMAYSNILSVGDRAVFYDGAETDYRLGVKVTEVGVIDKYASYVVEHLSIEELFEECDVSYYGDIDFNYAELDKNLTANLEEAFLESDVYAQYVEAVSLLSNKYGSKMGTPVYTTQVVKNGSKLTVKLSVSANMDNGLIFTMDYYVDIQMNVVYNENGRNSTVLLSTDMTNTVVLDVDSSQCYNAANSEKMLGEYREMFNAIKAKNALLAIDAEKGGLKTKSFKIATIPLVSGVFSINIDLTAEFEFAMMGGISAKLVQTLHSDIGIKNGEIISDYEANVASIKGCAYAGVDVFGGIGISLNAKFLCYTAYVKGIIGLHCELIAAAAMSKDNAGSYVLGGYYFDSEVLLDLRVGFKGLMFDKSVTFYQSGTPFISFGKADVFLHFEKSEHASESEALDFGSLSCGNNQLDLNTRLGATVLVVNAATLETYSQNVKCYFTYDVISGNVTVKYVKNGVITVCGEGEFLIRVNVYYNDVISKTAYIKSSVSHDYSREIVSSASLRSARTCYAPASYYYSCAGCGKPDTESGNYFEYGKTGTHSLEKVYDSEFHWQACIYEKCDYETEKTAHSGKATCQKLAYCSYCKIEYGSLLPCDEKGKITTTQYLASLATCKDAAKFYYSCSMCGAIGNTTFEYGSPTTKHNYNHNFTCVDRTCLVCGVVVNGNGNHTDIGGGVCGCDPDAFINGMLLVDNGDGTYNVSNYIGSLAVVEIPTETKNGDPIVGISANTFKNKSGITSISIPDSITAIGDSAFYGCSSLLSVKIPESVTSIGKEAFYGCNGITSIEYNAAFVSDFASDSKVFYNAGASSAGINLVIGENVSYIPSYCFYNANILNLTFVSSGCDSVGAYAFYGCKNISNVYFNGEMVAALFASNFSQNTKGDKKLYLNGELITEIVIPSSIEKIGSYAFDGCADLREVAISYGITYIDSGAFNNCRGLSEITVPDSVTLIGSGAFSGCTTLASMTLPFVGHTKNGTANTHLGYIFGASAYSNNSSYVPSALKTVTITGGSTIGEYAFYNCVGITSIEMPNSVTSIGASAFYNCKSLSSIWIPNGVTEIGNRVFYNCTGLISITIPDSVVSIGESAFNGCTGLTGVYITDLAKWCGIEFANNISNPLYCAGNLYLNGNLLTDIIIPDSTKKISKFAFYNCRGLTSVEIPNSVTSIGASAFYGCTGLTSITIPFVGEKSGYISDYYYFGYIFGATSASNNSKNVPLSLKTVKITGDRKIGESAFYGCAGLTSIEIPNSVTSIGASAFYGCTGLTSIEIPNSVTSIGASAFYGCTGLTSVDVPTGVTSIGRSAFSGCTGLTSITLPFVGSEKSETGNNLFGYIFGAWSYSENSSYIPSSLTTVKITGGKSITGHSFYNCRNITSIELPSSLTYIGNSAFFGCTKLESVYITDLTKWCEITFANSSSNPLYCAKNLYLNGNLVTDIIIPDGIMSIGSSAFYNYTSLTSVEIPNGVTSIGAYAFSKCTGLTSIEIPSSMTSIGNDAFYGCVKIVEVINNSSLNIVAGSSSNGYVAYYALEVHSGGGNRVVVGDYTFYSYDGNNYLVGYTGNASNIKLPTSYNGESYSIGAYAFYNCTSLTSVEIPDSVMSIGAYAFSGCTSLTEITLPFVGERKDGTTNTQLSYIFGSVPATLKTVKITGGSTIGYNAFYNCSGLTSIELPNSVTTIGNSAFAGCMGLTSLEIPNSVTSIGTSAFYGCSGLTGIELPSGVTVIGNYAFQYCTGFTSIDITDNITAIGESAFLGCTGLTSIEIPNSVTSIGASAFYGCTGLTSVEIPNSVTSIGASAFSGCTNLTEITLPFVGERKDGTTNTQLSYIFGEISKTLQTVKITGGSTIGDYAFSGWTGLTSIEMPNSVTSIGNYAFYNCTRLTSIEIPNSVTSIGNYAFAECKGLTSIEIPNSVTSIGNYAFYYCTGLTSIEMSNSVTSIGASAFYGCTGLTSVEIPNSVTSIGASAFSRCTNLTEITLPFVGERKDGTTNTQLSYIFGEISKTLQTVKITGGSTIGASAFSGCTGLTSIEIPNSVTSIGASAFSGCTGLTSLEIPNSVTSIGVYAFSECTGLTSIEMSNSVTSIGNSAFSGCTGLTSIDIPGSVTTIGSNAFENCNNLTIYCHAVSSQSGWASSWNSSRPVVYGYDVYTVIDGVYYGIKNGTAAIVRQPKFEAESFVISSEIVYENTTYPVVIIDSNAFEGCTGLASIEIPNSVTSIGNSAFSGCTGLASIEIPNSVTSIGNSAFYYCTGLTSIEMSNSVTSIGNYAFSGCTGLTSIEIPNNVTSIGISAFSGCTGLASLEIPNSVTSIGASAFYNCTSLTSVEIPNSVTSIGISAFSGCTGLTSIEIPNSVTSIGNYTFSGCTGLTSISVPNGINIFERDAVSGCTSLKYNEYDNAYYLGNESNPYLVLVCAKNNTITSCTIASTTRIICNYAFSGCSKLENVYMSNNVVRIGREVFYDFLGTESFNLTYYGTKAQFYAIVKATGWLQSFCWLYCTVDGYHASLTSNS